MWLGLLNDSSVFMKVCPSLQNSLESEQMGSVFVSVLAFEVFCLSKFAHAGSVRWRKNGEHVPSPSALGSFLLDICFLSNLAFAF